MSEFSNGGVTASGIRLIVVGNFCSIVALFHSKVIFNCAGIKVQRGTSKRVRTRWNVLAQDDLDHKPCHDFVMISFSIVCVERLRFQAMLQLNEYKTSELINNYYCLHNTCVQLAWIFLLFGTSWPNIEQRLTKMYVKQLFTYTYTVCFTWYLLETG